MANDFLESSKFAEDLIRSSVLNKHGWFDHTIQTLADRESLLRHVKCLQQAETAICQATSFEEMECAFTGTTSSYTTAHEAAATLLLHLLRIAELNHISADSDDAQRATVANQAYALGGDAQRVLKRMRIERARLLGENRAPLPDGVSNEVSSDTKKKPKKYRMDAIAQRCAAAFKAFIDSGERQTLHHFVIDWCAKESQRLKRKISAWTTEQRLGQNRHEWDPEGKYKNIRSPR